MTKLSRREALVAVGALALSAALPAPTHYLIGTSTAPTFTLPTLLPGQALTLWIRENEKLVFTETFKAAWP